MYVGIKYYKGGFYAGREYTYETALPLKVGDKVITPTVNDEGQRGIVTSINLPKPNFPCRLIDTYYTEEEAKCQPNR